MDHTTFDRLSRLISASRSRRAALRLLAGAILPATIGGGTEAKRKRRRADAKRHHADKRRRHGKARTETTAKRKTRSARAAGGCCARGTCAPGPGKKLTKCCYDDGQLSGQNFKGANLASASFARATLTDADFSGANVSQACFVDADTTGARFNGANTNGAIFCRTQTDSGEDNSGCDRGTPCCPTCDADHPCGADEVCCDGRCFAGDCCGNSEQSTCATGQLCCGHRCTEGVCCQAGDCPTETCQQRTCRDNQCAYTPITGQAGPGCQTVCCQDATGTPVCCPEGATTCDGQGLCCAAQSLDETCGVGTAAPRCGEVTNNCDQQVACGPCAERICQEGTCTGAGNTCEYRSVFGEPGPRCPTLCCRDAAGNPECCAAGVTQCFPSGGCRCRDNQDCATDEVCCDGGCEPPIWTNVATFGSGPRTAGGDFEHIVGVALSGDEEIAWVVDQGSSLSDVTPRVSVWSRQANGDWDLEETFGTVGDGVGEFLFPFGVAVPDDGVTALVSDQGNSRITIWSQQLGGSWDNTGAFGSAGEEDDQFDRPVGVAISGDGRTAWVVDQGNERVSVWARNGAGFWLPQTTFGTGAGVFADPVGVAVAASGETAWVVDRIATGVSIWVKQANGQWAFDTRFGSFGDHADQFRGPLGVAVPADGQTAFVADLGHDRISIWTRQANGDWTHVENFGGSGSGPSQFDGPLGIAVAANGRTVWVSDADNHRVSIWSLSGCPVT